ncbi:MAG: DNA-binding protein WhiA, partial [bacterium]
NYYSKIKSNTLVISTENILLITKTRTLISKIFNINLDIILEDRKKYKIIINNQIYIKKIIKIINSNYKENDCLSDLVNYDILKNYDVYSKRAYVRACFICIGYISDPIKNYHLEFINHSYEQASMLKLLMNDFSVYPKIIQKKDNFILYIKESEQIAQVLSVIETHKVLLEFENIRILKDVRNNINRSVNCETANITKVISASLSHIDDIEYIKSKGKFNELPPQLKEIAILRINNPDASLQELSLLTSPHIGKSGVNHRLKKINNIAKKIKDLEI